MKLQYWITFPAERENLPEGVPLYQVDITNYDAVQAVFQTVRPEHVVHLAAQISVSHSVHKPAEDARVNILGLLHVLENAVRYETQSFVFASSGGALYGDVDEPAGEEHEVVPFTVEFRR